jgi:hypothetical protein
VLLNLKCPASSQSTVQPTSCLLFYSSIIPTTVFSLKNRTLQSYTSLTNNFKGHVCLPWELQNYLFSFSHEMLRTWQDLFFSCSKHCAGSWWPLQPTSKPAVNKKVWSKIDKYQSITDNIIYHMCHMLYHPPVLQVKWGHILGARPDKTALFLW